MLAIFICPKKKKANVIVPMFMHEERYRCEKRGGRGLRKVKN